MATALILLDFEVPKAWQDQLAATLAPLSVVLAKNDATVDAATRADTEIIFGAPAPQSLAQYPQLKWLQVSSAGNDKYTPLFQGGAFAPGTAPVVTNASGAYNASVAEYMVAGVLAVSKRLHQYRDVQRAGVWQPKGRVKRIAGSTVLVVGLGEIGGKFAQLMKALGAYVIGVRRSKPTGALPEGVDEIVQTEALDEVLPRADIVVLIVPNTDATKGLFDAARLARMKPGAILLNAGRGTAVDTEALCDALTTGKLGGAVLDVTEPEPLPPGHPLWSIENAFVTPHVAGGFNMDGTKEAILDICLDNAARYKKGAELRNTVDFEIGYRRT